MAACDAQTLVNLTPALGGVPIGLVPYAQLALLCQIATAYNPMADCSAATLIDNAKCLACSVPPGLVQFAALALLCQINANGGGGGTGTAFTVGTGSPEGVVVGSPGDRFFATDTGFQYTKVTGTATNTGWSV